jgi:hypothetical protein
MNRTQFVGAASAFTLASGAITFLIGLENRLV